MTILRAKVGGSWVDVTQVAGPKGDKGETQIVVKSTQPTAADYGQASIPVGAVWVQSP